MAQAALLVEEPVSAILDASDQVIPSAAAPAAYAAPRWSLSRPRGDIVAPRARRRPLVWAAAGLLAAAAVLAFAKPRLAIGLLPRLAPVYRAIGMPINPRGVAFEHVSARLEQAPGGHVLLVEGLLRNVSAGPIQPARLRIVLTDGGGRPLYRWIAHSGAASLQAGEVTPFRTRLAAPPAEAQGVTVDFAPDGERS